MNRNTTTMKTDQMIKAVKCDTKTMFSEPFYIITVDGSPVGRPLKQEEAVLIEDWFSSIILEFDNESDRNDVY